MVSRRQPGHPLSGYRQQLSLAIPDPVARHGLDPPQPGVPFSTRARPNGMFTFEMVNRRRRDELVERGKAWRWNVSAPFWLAQPDGDHLHQAALDLAAEVGVRT